jgi:hypothetical protein
MKIPYRPPIILFFASFLLIGAGMLFKIQHYPYASIIFGAGMSVQMFSILWLIWVIVRPGKK